METGKNASENVIVEKKHEYLWECVSFIIFVIACIVMFFFHEPWYDEIQAWMVASDASITDMIWDLPHFEGHPPFWTLILALFAQNGVPMEVGLRLPSIIFSALAAYLVMFKAPFKKWIRCLIPFTYFLFYQYTVICRPYSMMLLGFVLAAYCYKERNRKPFRFLCALFILCMSSAYGILIAGMICIVWTYEIVKELLGKGFFKKAVCDKRTWGLCLMLFAAIGLLSIIWPSDSAFAQVRVSEFSALRCLIYMFLVLPADALISDVALLGRLQQHDTIIRADTTVILCIILSVLLYVVILTALHVLHKKALFILPFTAFAGYGAIGYFYNHHIGIVPLLLLFVFWCALDEKPEELKLPRFLQKIEKNMTGFSKKTGYFFVALALGMSLFWTVMAVKNDILLPVWYAKDLAAMMDEYDLTQYRVVNQWTYEAIEKDTNVSIEEDIQNNPLLVRQLAAEDYHQFIKMCNFVDILAYSDKRENYIINFNNGDPNKRYVDHDMLTQEESLAYLQGLGEAGYPEVIIGDVEILGMMGLDANKYAYIPVYSFICYRINKYNTVYANSFVYVREDIFMTREDWPIYEQIANGFTR